LEFSNLDFNLGNAGRMKKARLINWAKRALQGRSRGLTLVEVLITIALIGAIAVAFFNFMSTAAATLIHADERTVAESLARSQMEFIRNNGYNSTATYGKVPYIPTGYTIWSVNSGNQTVNGGASDRVAGVAWDSVNNKPATADTGLQMIALVIKHKVVGGDKVIYTFVNNNTNWANGVEITLEDYIRQS
jgi:prepilin-type N-terminal cleavage/methylation domain-containing protein